MLLARFPRRRYTDGPTPLEPLDQLSEELGGPRIWVKRDDLTGLAGGGNKTRKLEFLVADALAQGADTLITCGAVQSNHCRLTLAAAVEERLRCRLVLEERVPGGYDPSASGNNFLYRLLGAERLRVVPSGTDLDAALAEEARALAAEGRHGYVISGGGSTPLGALGYVACAQELLAQTFDRGVEVHQVVCASGSAGTHAGLIAGMALANARLPVIGISVRHSREDQGARVLELARATARLAGTGLAIHEEMVAVKDEYVGPGYSLPTEGMIEAVRMAARLEGLLLDPVYTGKAMAGLIDMVRSGRIAPNENVVFLHTGGWPSLFAYQDVVLSGEGAR